MLRIALAMCPPKSSVACWWTAALRLMVRGPVNPRGPPLRTLPDDRLSASKQRRTDTYVCRATRDRLLQIAAHPRGHDRGPGVSGPHGGRHLSQPREGRRGVRAERGDRHDTTELQPLSPGDGVREAGHLREERPAPPGPLAGGVVGGIGSVAGRGVE